MEQFVDAVKTSITNGLASTSLHNVNCKDCDTKLLDTLHSLRSRMLLYQIHPEVVVGRPFMMVSVAVVLQSKCRGTEMLHMSVVSLSGMCHMLSQVMTARRVSHP